MEILSDRDLSKSKRNEIALLFGHLTSKLGDMIFDYANKIVIVSAFTKMPWVLALYQSAESVIGIIFNIIGGVVADFGKKKKIIIASDIFSALICFGASFFISSKIVAVALILANALLALVFAFQSPCFRSVISQMVDKDRIVKYNSVNNAGMEVINIIGPILGVVLIGYVGARGALLINALTFLVSAISEMTLVPLQPEVPNKKKPTIKELPSGILFVWNKKTILVQIIACAFTNFFLAAYNLMAPYTEIMHKGIYEGYYSKLLIADAVGGIVGSLLNAKIANRMIKNSYSLLTMLGWVGVSLLLIPIACLTGNLWISLIPFLLFSMTLSMYNINFMSYIQMEVEESIQGRVFSVVFTFIMLFMPFGSFVFSALRITESIQNFYIPGIGIIIVATLCFVLNYFINNEESK